MHTNLYSFRPQDKKEFRPESDLFRVDPLWKKIYGEISTIMGPAVFPIEACYFGAITPRHERVDIYCQTEEVAQFARHYDFVILAELRKYFPSIKELRFQEKDH